MEECMKVNDNNISSLQVDGGLRLRTVVGFASPRTVGDDDLGETTQRKASSSRGAKLHTFSRWRGRSSKTTRR